MVLSASGAAGAEGGADPALDEIVVTARKRAESLQEIPVSVTALSAASLERQQIRNLQDMNYSVPNFSAFTNQTTTNSAAPFIRGIGQDDSTPVQEQGVATYVDDVYLARAQGGLLDLVEFERVEVLRGPQGTLYGRNSSGGAIKFVTMKPSLTDLAVLAEATVGRFSRVDLRGALSAPLVQDKLGVRLDLVSRERDGYITQVGTGADVTRLDRQTGRLAARWLPAPTVTVDFSIDGTRDRSGLQGGVPIAPTPGGSLPGGYAPVHGSIYVTGADVPDLNEFDGWGAANIVTWDTAAAQLKSVTAYRSYDNTFWSDLGGRPGNLDLFRNIDGRQTTQELQATSAGEGRLTWVAGLFYMDEEFTVNDQFLFRHDYTQQTRSAAVYGELGYAINDRWRVNVGGRYTEDRKEIDMDGLGLGGTFSVRGLEESFSDFSPKVSTDYRLSDQVMIFAVAQEGYKAGAFQGFPQQLTDLTEEIVQPEVLRAYEIGAKTEWLNGRVVLNASYFFSDYKEKQINAFNPATLGFASRTADAEIHGLEVEYSAAVTDRLLLFGYVATLNGEITGADSADPLVPPRGTPIAFMPELSAKVGIDYRFPFDAGGEIFLNGNLTWKDDVNFALFQEPYVTQEAHELLDARVGYRTRDQRLEFSVGGENLTNVEWAYTAAVVDGGTLWMSPPRTWSVLLRYRY